MHLLPHLVLLRQVLRQVLLAELHRMPNVLDPGELRRLCLDERSFARLRAAGYAGLVPVSGREWREESRTLAFLR